MRRVGSSIIVLFLACVLISSAYAADTLTESQRLAILATNMLALAGTGDYRLECGPASAVLPTIGATTGSYCVMIKGSGSSASRIYGTFSDPTGDATSVLETFQNDLFANHVAKTSVKTASCRGLEFSEIPPVFKECGSALSPTTGRLRVYYLDNSIADSDVGYVLVSENSLTATSFVDTVLDFFGLGGRTVPFISSTDEFDHAYFARAGTGDKMRTVTATWLGNDAVIQYKNFVTDFKKIKPTESEFYLGNGNTQVIKLSLDTTDKSLRLWREYTSRLRIDPTATGTPVTGDTCGNGVVGFDEQCEPTLFSQIPDAERPACSSINGDLVDGKPVNFVSGKLKCKTNCQYDVSECIGCSSEDADTFAGGQGSTGLVKPLSGAFSLGTAMPYGTFTDEANDLETARMSAQRVKQEVLPVSYDIMFNVDPRAQLFFDLAMTRAETSFAACTKGALICEQSNYGNVSNLLHARDAAMRNLLSFSTNADALKYYDKPAPKPCVLGAEKLSCPDGFSAWSNGVTTNYSTILPTLKSRGIAPIIRITLGGCDSASCGPYSTSAADAKWKFTAGIPTKNTYTDAELRKIYAYCFLTADGLGQQWQTADMVSPSTFIVIGDPAQAGMSVDTYGKVYDHCRRGIEDAVGTNATVLYGLPPLGATNSFIAKVKEAPANYDGVYVESPIQIDKYQEYDIAGFTSAITALDLAGVPTYVRASQDQTAATMFGSRLPLAAALANVYLLYDPLTTRPFSTIQLGADGVTMEETISSATRYWSAVVAGTTLGQGDVVTYSFKELPRAPAAPTTVVPVPAGVYVFWVTNEAKLAATGTSATSKSTVTIINTNTNAVDVPMDFTSCGITKLTTITSTGAVDKTSPITYNKNIPAQSIVNLTLTKGPSCLGGVTGASEKCKVIVDCQDAKDATVSATVGGVDIATPTKDINPAHREVCGNGVDDNCDGRIDEAGCTPMSTAPALTLKPKNGYACNYDGTCDDSEDPAACVDCFDQIACPTARRLVRSFDGFDIFVYRNITGHPRMVLAKKMGNAVLSNAPGTPGTRVLDHGCSASDSDNNRYTSGESEIDAGIGIDRPVFYATYSGGGSQVIIGLKGSGDEKTGKWTISGSGSHSDLTCSGWGSFMTTGMKIEISVDQTPGCSKFNDRTCKIDGDACTTSTDCCTNRLCKSGVCSNPDPTSSLSSGACKVTGRPCGVSTDCCSGTCTNYLCASTAGPGSCDLTSGLYDMCGDTCTYTYGDPRNCGTCGNDCSPGSCQAGTCIGLG